MPPLPPLLLLRHGETEANRAGVLQGQGDSPLTPRGRAQAAAMGVAVATALPADTPITLWVSPLGRVRQSLAEVRRALAGRCCRVHFDARLKEIAFGAWTLVPAAQLAQGEAAAAWAARQADPWRVAPPGGEAYADLARRVEAFLADLARAHGAGGAEAGRAPVILAHGGTGRVIRGLLTGLDTAAIPLLPAPQDAIIRLDGPEGGGAVPGRGVERWLATAPGPDRVPPLPVGRPDLAHRVAPARPTEAVACQAVERDAAYRFAAIGDLSVDPTQATPLDALVDAAETGRLRTIREDGVPVAFALEDRVDGLPVLAELSVTVAAGGKGYGRALVADVLARARATGAARLLLTTFIDIPWNGPWYERLGFQPVPQAECGPALRAALADQATRYPGDRRQAMEFWL